MKDIKAFDALLEKGFLFSIVTEEGERLFEVKPPTVGKLARISQLIDVMNLDDSKIAENPLKEAARLFREHCDEIGILMAVAVAKNANEYEDEIWLRKTAKFIIDNVTPKSFTEILKYILTNLDYVSFMNGFRLLLIYKLKMSIEKVEDRKPE